MNSRDKMLGMDRDISRRDFINGMTMATAALAWPSTSLWAQDKSYPPERLGLRGSHPGSFEAAHALRDGQAIDPGRVISTGEEYDLVIVGAGLSGLAAGHYFQKNAGRETKVLLLDNHDDFGGHAKRNELSYQDKLIVLNGGTLEIEAPERYNRWATQLLDDIGVDLARYRLANKANESLYASFGLRGAHFFDRETFGTDRLVVSPASDTGDPRRRQFTADSVRHMPLSAKAKKDLLRLEDPDQPDYMPGLSSAEKKARLARMSYRDYLLNVAKVDESVYWFYMATGRAVFCVGGDAVPALFAWQMGGGTGGFSGLKLDPSPEGLLADLPGGQHGRQQESEQSVHFPDGNATLARLLVRWLIPSAVPGNTQEDVGAARVNYGALDVPSNSVRLRLNSTVLNVRQEGTSPSPREVIATYSRAGQLYAVRARACIMACWNMFIPYLVPELPAPQKAALADNVKGPIVYTSVFLRNWRAFHRLGASAIQCPTMYHDTVELAEPANLGAIQHARNPDEPIALRMTRTPGAPGLARKAQHRVGRAELLATPFEVFERNIREQLTRILSPGGFDAKTDIIGIAVNRWPHGYSYTYNSLYDPMEWVFTESDERPCVIARQPYGLISIANADAAASPHTDAAFQEAHRAVTEVLARRAAPFLVSGA